MNGAILKPQRQSREQVIFADKVSHLLPAWNDIPEDFRRCHDGWSAFVSQWFFQGVNESAVVAKSGIDKTVALSHCAAIMRSWVPSHEHKIAGVAYLMSLWFDLVPSTGNGPETP